MSKLIALKSSLEILPDLLTSKGSSQFKQQALLFDCIGILRLNTIVDSLEKIDTGIKKTTISHSLTELKWLIENGILFEPTLPSKKLETLLTTTLGKHYATEYRKAKNEIEILKSKRTKAHSVKQEFINISIPILNQDSIVLRLLSATMNKGDDTSTIASLSETDYTYEILNSNKRDVIKVVIRKLPVPGNMTSWEQIIDYRNDPENQNNLLGLRRWIRKISTEELSKAEIEDEIEWRINEFQRHMKYHKIKANTETVEVLVKAPLEIIENLVKLKLSKIPEPFFAVKKRQLMLMEAEMNAPGKELAYIIKSREAFQPQE